MTDEQHTGRCRMAEDVKAVAVEYPDTGFRKDAEALALWEAFGFDTGGEPYYSHETVNALRAEVERLRIEVTQLKDVRALLSVQSMDYEGRAQRAEAQAAAAEGLAARWERVADEHGVRQFTGNDHRLFANELRAALSRAATDTQAGERGEEG